MRILHVTTEYPPLIFGGLGTAVGGLATASARAGLQVAVLLIGGHSSAYESSSCAVDPSEAPALEGSVLLQHVPHSTAVQEGISFAQAWKPDVLHVHVFWLAHVALAIRAATGVPIVYTVHSLDRAEYDLGEGPPECLTQWNIQADLMAAADRIVATRREHVDERGAAVA